MVIDVGRHNRSTLLAFMALAIAIIAIIILFYLPIGSIFFSGLSIFLAWRSSANILGDNPVLREHLAKAGLVLALILSLFTIISAVITTIALPNKHKLEKVYESGVIYHKR